MIPVFGQRISCQEIGTMTAPVPKANIMKSVKIDVYVMLTCLALRENYTKIISGSSDIVASCIPERYLVRTCWQWVRCL
jgi:hypothetical protein